MPWKAASAVDLRFEFISRLNKGERLTDLCREYGISRKTGHKFKARYAELGPGGLVDQSRAPKHIPHRMVPELQALFVAERRRHPSWGAAKLKAVLEKRHGRQMPSTSAIHALLTKHGMVPRYFRRPKNYREQCTSHLTEARGPNDVWCADYKGQFRLGDGSYCYPLTVTDQFSRFILECQGMVRISEEGAKEVFEHLFKERGLPKIIRSDNGVPFASVGLAALSKLNVFWLRLRIKLERIRPGSPQENGRHERMHRTLKRETTRPARHSLLQQQETFDRWVEEFNQERPHEAIDMKPPVEVYEPSPRPFEGLPPLEYPTHDDTLIADRRGSICVRAGSCYISKALAGQPLGIREEDDGRVLVTFIERDLGHVDLQRHFIPIASTLKEEQ